MLSVLLAATTLIQGSAYRVQVEGVPQVSTERVTRALRKGVEVVETYFSKPFAKKFVVNIAPNRAAFDVVAGKRWKMPPSEKWMVGVGGPDILLILSPDRWKEEVVEHDGESDRELEEIVAHELVHVYHAQMNPKPEFEGMDDLGWFIEGLAVRVSGQLERTHRAAAMRAIKEGKSPKTLAEAWSGRYRYGVSGSMVKYVEARWGKRAISDLLRTTTNDLALSRLHITQDKFLADWKTWVANANGEGSEVRDLPKSRQTIWTTSSRQMGV